IGRTRFIEVLAGTARDDGYAVAAGSCLRMDAGAMPYAAIIAALRGLTRTLDEGALAASLGPARRDVARLLPEVARLGVAAPARPTVQAPVGPGTARPSPTDAPDAESLARLRLFEAVGAWLERLADLRPILLEVEDLHWADPATLDLVR